MTAIANTSWFSYVTFCTVLRIQCCKVSQRCLSHVLRFAVNHSSIWTGLHAVVQVSWPL